MKILMFALTISAAVMLSILLLWAGIHTTWAYYATEQNVHDLFAIAGPCIILAGFVLPFGAIDESLRAIK